MPKEHIVVIGAGIAGLHLAIQILTHAADLYTVAVYEKVFLPPLSRLSAF
jgi:2-polyprenyl-6-methoxyphenol hydroxylase-like FAD-dependent oxidoreductase